MVKIMKFKTQSKFKTTLVKFQNFLTQWSNFNILEHNGLVRVQKLSSLSACMSGALQFF